MRLPVPKRVQERLAPLVERTQAFLKTWEWTWTSAVVASMVIAFVTLTFTVFIPSWWLYFADQKLGWHKCPCTTTLKFFEFKARDVVAVILFSIPFGGFIMIPYHLQKLRRRLRSESDSRPTGGYR